MKDVKSFLELTDEEKWSVLRWRNHPDIRSRMFSSHEISLEEHLAFLNHLKSDPTSLYWMVGDQGVVSLKRLDKKNGNAYLGIYKNPADTIKDSAKELMRVLLSVTFDQLNLHTLKLEVFSDNPRAVNFYNKCGFNQEGRLREFIKREDKVWADLILMGITRAEFVSETDTTN
ncbi:MAG: UDP-4-amino-4,6-dideoxy-N-acetyl-beta-L-altrosamine N-acetyltransferase [Bdellovibrio sp.]|nr:UDP-4-amino-4,6-dideoxy-N-acetyl-beta-L-altrosamine N-acetyltransferase [Bdellovibrio sp.]